MERENYKARVKTGRRQRGEQQAQRKRRQEPFRYWDLKEEPRWR